MQLIVVLGVCLTLSLSLNEHDMQNIHTIIV